MLALIVSAALALAGQTHATPAHAAGFPTRGVVVPGQTIGGVGLSMSELQVRQRWGGGYVVCGPACGPLLTWLYEYQSGEPLGAAVKFNVPNPPSGKLTAKQAAALKAQTASARTVAVFTLGSPVGWGIKGLMMGDPVTNVYNLFGNPAQVNCIGYDALSVRIGTATMSFYSASGVIYGYALTASSQPTCQ